MKVLQRRIQQAAKDGGVNQLAIERDYAQTYILLGLASQPELRDTLVFKGGTALKKVHFGVYRFSEDLDFSAENGPKEEALESAIRAAMVSVQVAARQHSPITVSVERYEEREPHPGVQEAFIARVQFPWQRQPIVPVKIEVTHDEPVLLPAPPMPVRHGYDEALKVFVRTYCLEEICAEKLRSTRQTHAKLATRGWARSRGRDYFDLWHLMRLDSARVDWTKVCDLLPRKCAHRQVAIMSVVDIFEPALLDEVRATWERTLGPFVPELPAVETVFAETRARLEAVLKL
ncbi:MAG: nucleotidyl transferase AbiEii/AbiGii toxin family protein [Myxococcota bacterium]|jgi:predicted nucleotidyltransferase component of viral defense system|nr:nucleotidyl transferase AbiEii/AbiGii toxin family protein [Myxococcota bacterium]